MNFLPENSGSDADTACLRLIQELAWFTDQGDYERALALFDDAAIMDRDGEMFTGVESLRAAFAARPSNRITRHVLTNTIVRAVGPDEAVSTSYVTVYRYVLTHAGDLPPYALSGPDVLGEYRDRFRRRVDGWRLCERVTRTILRFNHSTGSPR